MAPLSSKLPPLPSQLPPSDEINQETLSKLADAYSLAAARLTPESKRSITSKDAFRFEELPALIQQRRGKAPTNGDGQWTSGWLEKGDLERLMDWKLHRGTWRPSLPGLIRSNAAADVVSATARALHELSLSLSTTPPSSAFPTPTLKAALKTAASLKGVGPATASLILAAAAPEEAPFMADETYRWFMGVKPQKYNDKELQTLWDHVAALRKRLPGVTAVDVERAVAVAAWGRDGRVEGWVEAGEEGDANHENEEGEGKEGEEGKGKESRAGKRKSAGGSRGDGKKRKADSSAEVESESKSKATNQSSKPTAAKMTRARRGR